MVICGKCGQMSPGAPRYCPKCSMPTDFATRLFWTLVLAISVIALLFVVVGTVACSGQNVARIDDYEVLVESSDPDLVPERVKASLGLSVGPVPIVLSIETTVLDTRVRVTACIEVFSLNLCADCTTGKGGSCQLP